MSAFFRLSLGTNILLMGVVALLLLRDQRAVTPRAGLLNPPTFARSEMRNADPVDKPRPPHSPVSLFSAASFVQLEQSGVSHQTLVNVLLEDLNRRSAKRVLELQKKYAPRLVPDREMRELTRESDAEQIRELKGAFGEEGYLAWDKEQTLRNLNRARVPGDDLAMTAGEAEKAYQLQKEFDEKNQELQMAMEDGVADKADAGMLGAQAQRTLDRELEKLLGKQRFDELRGNTGPTTEVYRVYGELTPTSEQAKAVVQAEGNYRTHEAALAKRLSENPEDPTDVAVELKVLSDVHEKNLRQIFGAADYENMKRQNDPTYKTLQQYAGAWGLGQPEIQSVYEALQPFQEQASRTRAAAEMREAAGQRVNWREIDSGIEQARQQTEASLQHLIGGERLQRLKQNEVLTNR